MFGFLAGDDHGEDVVGRHVGHVHRADELAVLHHARPVAELLHLVDVVVDQEDAEALLLQLPISSATIWSPAGPSAAVGSSMIRIFALK
jgi:hypothetical protein